MSKYEEKPTKGSIYDFKSLLVLSDNALSIGEFEKTGNVNYLIPLFTDYPDIQHKLEGTNIYENIGLFSHCREVFVDVIDFVKNSDDPIICKFRQQIIDKLSWITIEANKIDRTKLSNTDIKRHNSVCRCLDRAHFYIDKKYPDYFKAILYAYQTSTYLLRGSESASENVLGQIKVEKDDIDKLSNFKKYRNNLTHKYFDVDENKYSEQEMTMQIHQILDIVDRYL